MIGRRKPNPKYLASEADSAELDQAIDRAIKRSPKARADFIAASLAMDLQRARKKAGLTREQVALRDVVRFSRQDTIATLIGVISLGLAFVLELFGPES